MSSRRGAISESYAVGVAVSQINSQHAARVQRMAREHPIRPKTLPLNGEPQEIQEDTLIVEDEVSGIEGALGSTDQWRSAGPSPALVRLEQARRDVRATVLGYASVDAEHSEGSNHDLQRQMDEIAGECERRGLRLLEIVRERERKRQRPLERPGLGYALGRIATGEAGGLVVAELSGVSHSVPELGTVLDWLARRDARFVAAIPRVDTAEESGRLVVRTIIEVSRWERKRLGARTREGMRAARRKGPASVADYPDLRERIATMRAGGMTLQAIADQLNAEGVPTVRGGTKWRPSSVQAAAGYQRPPTGYMLDLRPGRTNRRNAEAEEA